MLKVHRDRAASVTAAFPEVPNNSWYQIVEPRKDGTIAAFKARQPEGHSCLVNGGVYLVEPAELRGLTWPDAGQISLEDEILPALVEEGRRIIGYVASGRFIDIGLPADYTAASELLAHLPPVVYHPKGF